MVKNNFNLKEGDIVEFYYHDAQKNKYAVNVEVVKIRKKSFAGVIMTSKKIDRIYPGDYLLPEGIMPLPTKIICDKIVDIDKKEFLENCAFL